MGEEVSTRKARQLALITHFLTYLARDDALCIPMESSALNYTRQYPMRLHLLLVAFMEAYGQHDRKGDSGDHPQAR